ncbi:MAG: alpha/beta hydrolase [Hyphomicrobiales bacterium]
MSEEILAQLNIEYLSVGNDDEARSIAYIVGEGSNTKSGLFWLSGFKSSMRGLKAEALAQWAHANDHVCTRMDYSGHGASHGDFLDGTITRWLEEALAVFKAVTKGPQIIIGSSMGGWLALLLAHSLARENRVVGIILIAPAWDMTERLMMKKFSDDARDALEKDGFYKRPSEYQDDDYIITKKLIDDGQHHLIGDKKMHLNCPLHILHGQKDVDVPWQHGQELMTLLPRDDVTFTLVPDGDHRLSRDEDLDRLLKIIAAIV